MNPLPTLLEGLRTGFELKGIEKIQITHLAYMETSTLLRYNAWPRMEIKAIEEFSRDINMQLGIDKCKIQETEG